MALIKLSKSEPAIDISDLELLESSVGYSLPEYFRRFYLGQNGGVADKDWWDSNDEYEPVRVKKFKSIAKFGADDAADTKFLGGCYAAMTSKSVIPQTLLPFAIDDGGNFFCLDLTDGNICFFATDAYDPSSSFSTNHAKAYRWLASSFQDFIEGLKDESDIDV